MRGTTQINNVIKEIKKLDTSYCGASVYISTFEYGDVENYKAINGFIKGDFYYLRMWTIKGNPNVVECEVAFNTECPKIIHPILDNCLKD